MAMSQEDSSSSISKLPLSENDRPDQYLLELAQRATDSFTMSSDDVDKLKHELKDK